MKWSTSNPSTANTSTFDGWLSDKILNGLFDVLDDVDENS
jgi:hypothetical protein